MIDPRPAIRPPRARCERAIGRFPYFISFWALARRHSGTGSQLQGRPRGNRPPYYVLPPPHSTVDLARAMARAAPEHSLTWPKPLWRGALNSQFHYTHDETAHARSDDPTPYPPYSTKCMGGHTKCMGPHTFSMEQSIHAWCAQYCTVLYCTARI